MKVVWRSDVQATRLYINEKPRRKVRDVRDSSREVLDEGSNYLPWEQYAEQRERTIITTRAGRATR